VVAQESNPQSYLDLRGVCRKHAEQCDGHLEGRVRSEHESREGDHELSPDNTQDPEELGRLKVVVHLVVPPSHFEGARIGHLGVTGIVRTQYLIFFDLNALAVQHQADTEREANTWYGCKDAATHSDNPPRHTRTIKDKTTDSIWQNKEMQSVLALLPTATTPHAGSRPGCPDTDGLHVFIAIWRIGWHTIHHIQLLADELQIQVVEHNDEHTDELA
jgi:hypothetical protein